MPDRLTVVEPVTGSTTVSLSEIAFYGSTKFGINSDGNISSNSNSCGFLIGNYTF